MPEIFVGRQPIYDRQLDLYAYELLFRGDTNNRAEFVDGDKATAIVILNTFVEIGLQNVLGNSPAFINATRNFLVSGHWRSLPNELITLEVLEDITPDDEVISALKEVSAAGFKIALDDFVYEPELLPLVEAANVIKVELPAIKKEDLPEHVSILKQYNVKLLAEKIETYEEFELCKALGFDLFQGYFFCKPKVIGTRQIPVAKQSAMLLVVKLQNENIQPDEIVEIIRMDLSLSYKLLRFVNSTNTALSRTIESIRDAIIITGLERLKTWVTIMSFAGMEDKPSELLVTAMIRAKMGELLAKKSEREDPEKYFTAGLFSLLHAFMDQPMEKILESLPIAPELKNALLTWEGPIGDTLRCVVNYEKGNWHDVSCIDLSNERICESYLEAVAWSREYLSMVL